MAGTKDKVKSKKVKLSKREIEEEESESENQNPTEKDLLERDFKKSSVPIAQLLKQMKEVKMIIISKRMASSDLYTLAKLQVGNRIYHTKVNDIIKTFKKLLKQQGYDKCEIQDEIKAIDNDLKEIEKEIL